MAARRGNASAPLVVFALLLVGVVTLDAVGRGVVAVFRLIWMVGAGVIPERARLRVGAVVRSDALRDVFNRVRDAGGIHAPRQHGFDGESPGARLYELWRSDYRECPSVVARRRAGAALAPPPYTDVTWR